MSLFGGFGASTQQQPQQQQQGGTLFSQPQASVVQGGAFGGVSSSSPFAPQASTGFGQQQQQQQQTAGFGASPFNQLKPQQPQQGFGFGSTLGQQQQQPQQQQQQQPQQSFLGSSMFGQSQQQQPQQQQQQPGQSLLGGSLLGSNTGGFQSGMGGFNQSIGGQSQLWQSQMGQSQLGQSQLAQSQLAQSQSQVNNVRAQLERIHSAWDVRDPNSHFHYYLYNQAENEILANSYEAGPGEDKQKFDAAMRRKPNPKAVPVLVRGFPDLQVRMQQQEQQINLFRHSLHQINNKLNELAQTHDLYTTIKFSEALGRHQQLAHRVLSLTAKVQVLKNRGYALQSDEEELRKRLETLAKVIQDPGVVGRVNEIWARMTIVKEKARQMEAEVTETGQSVDPSQIQKMALVLKSHEKGIQGLRDEVRQIEETFEKWQKEKAEKMK